MEGKGKKKMFKLYFGFMLGKKKNFEQCYKN